MRFPNGMVRATLLMGGFIYASMIFFVLRKLTRGICIFVGGTAQAGMTTTDYALLVAGVGIPLLLFALLGIEYLVRVHRRKLPGHCTHCGIDGVAMSARCPACGTRHVYTGSQESLFTVDLPTAKPYRSDDDSASMPRCGKCGMISTTNA